MKKKTISFILVLCLIISTVLSVPVFAASPTITLDKTEYTVLEEAKATFSGVTGEELCICLAPEGTRYENSDFQLYYDDLPLNNVWTFRVPSQYGKYEVRLLDYYTSELIASASFSVVGSKAKEGDITVSKNEVLLREPMSVTVNGLTEGQIENGAWLGIVKYDEKLENTYHNSYVSDLDMNNTYKFEAPSRFGKYEVRVFSSYGLDIEESFFGKAEFTVVSSKAKPGDIVLSKTNPAPEEAMTVTVNGLTPGEIEEGAWLGIAKYDEKLQNTYHHSYISDLKMGNIYEFKAPSEPGRYEVRVFCKYGLDEAEYEYALFGKAEFTVGGAPVQEIAPGTNGLSTWAAPDVNEAVDKQLVTEKVLSEFPKDITREEFCELAVLLYEKMTGTKAAPVAANPFNDTNNPEILKAYNLGIVGGVGGGKFAPNNKVTRQEIAVMLLRALKAVMPTINTTAEFKTKFQDEGQIANWALEAVRFMNSHDIIRGTEVGGVSYILPLGNTTREQAISLVLRIYNTFTGL